MEPMSAVFPLTAAITALLLPARAPAQGTFIYDQQSSTVETPLLFGGIAMQTFAPPWGRSFTPGLSGIDFIRLTLADVSPFAAQQWRC
jgi:hypothetical protein